jgi:acetylornithine/N-succinyldiaminopimelate aminotransferase
MLGLKCRPKNTDVISACHEERLLAIAAGDNVVRLLPPLTVNPAEISEALECLDRACLSLEKAGAVQALA